MQVTAEGQVTIPPDIREKLGLAPDAEVDFREENGRFYLVKIVVTPQRPPRFRKLRGIATIRLTTDQIMALTRGET